METMEPPPDFGTPTNPLLLQTLAGDFSNPEIAREFYQKYDPIIRKYIDQLGPHESMTEDLIQSVYTKILEKIRVYRHRGTGSFRSWLKVIIKNTHIDMLREIPKTTCDDPAFFIRQKTAEAAFLEDFDQEYRRELLEVATARVRLEIDPQTWDIFRAGQLENLPAPQVAMRYGVKVSTIYSINYRILKRLRELCQKLDQPKSTSLEGDTCHP